MGVCMYICMCVKERKEKKGSVSRYNNSTDEVKTKEINKKVNTHNERA